MPKMNGLEVWQKVSEIYESYNKELEEPNKFRLPYVIFMSALCRNENFRNHCRSKGVIHFVEKPISKNNVGEILSIVSKEHLQ